MTPSRPGPIGRDPARELARRELEKAPYRGERPSVAERILRKITDWINQVLHQFDAAGGGSGGSWLGAVVLVVVLVIVVAAIWWRAGSPRRNAAARAALFGDERISAADHRLEAERHAAAGAWPHAIRERLRAIARDLEERAIVTPRAGRTADELAAEAGAALPGQAEELAAAVRLFDDVWYGGRDGDADGYRRLVELDQRLRAARPVPLASADTR